MLIWIDENKKITEWNVFIEAKVAQEYVGDKCLWIEGLEIKNPVLTENQYCEMYLNEDNTIKYQIEEKETERLTEQEQLILETTINTEYLVALADLGL